MRTLIISDLHLGDLRCERTNTVLKVLKDEKYDQIVLAGDIVDLWIVKPDEVRDHAVIKVLSNIAKDKKVVWVLGNHDWEGKGKEIIPGAIETDSFVIEEAGRKILCIHGHQLYEFQNMTWYTKLLSVLNFKAWVWFKVNIQRIFNRGMVYQWLVRKRREAIIKKYNDFDTIVIGHTHLVGYRTIDKTELYDIGSLTIRRTYAIVEEGYVSLRKA